ncbi:DNA topoisomerase [Pacificimonas flava]|uniref:DNA topoisomerase n=2 Tax=Pacificimonas TaxID=1960290 RepID=A0A219B7G4_9SPHN|nr:MULTISPECIES: DNA topoisomerase IB [Pacificimonas]MBZ6378392.1 DNA topoisomerase IB [Pacificimonas aurantium]OWV34305.1 DNA topoisomerase [Pacificimonas flava]
MNSLPSGLVYSHDTQPGFTRQRRGKGWAYLDSGGAPIKDGAVVERLTSLAVPPAYSDVWYCRLDNGHLQATGRDERGRKQYRYHPDFRAFREADKFSRTAEFGANLPALRERVEADLRRRSLSFERMVAATVRMLDVGALRIGNRDYARLNGAFGATTLTKDHADVRGESIYLEYRAKGGKERKVRLSDGSLARLARRCEDLPGQHLFAWQDEEDRVRGVSSDEVNDYIRAEMGEAFTAKNFRTWHASAIAYYEIVKARGDITLKAMLTPVAERLGNTITISRKSYVHPELIEFVKSGKAASVGEAGLQLPRKSKYLASYERGLIDFLDGRAD